VAIRATDPHRAGRVHGGLIGLCVAGNASGALAVGLLLRLAHQVRTSFLIGGAQRRRRNPRGYHGKEQARGQRSQWRGMRDPGKDIAIFQPAIHSAFSDQTARSRKIISLQN